MIHSLSSTLLMFVSTSPFMTLASICTAIPTRDSRELNFEAPPEETAFPRPSHLIQLTLFLHSNLGPVLMATGMESKELPPDVTLKPLVLPMILDQSNTQISKRFTLKPVLQNFDQYSYAEYNKREAFKQRVAHLRSKLEQRTESPILFEKRSSEGRKSTSGRI